MPRRSARGKQREGAALAGQSRPVGLGGADGRGPHDLGAGVHGEDVVEAKPGAVGQAFHFLEIAGVGLSHGLNQAGRGLDGLRPAPACRVGERAFVAGAAEVDPLAGRRAVLGSALARSAADADARYVCRSVTSGSRISPAQRYRLSS